jgi:trans-2,3-dihydro-3-hydroxyanthranilate isomerase
VCSGVTPDPVAPAASLEYHVVDVFTDRAFAGNPLAVVLGADRLADGQLQALAREFHLSETAFPVGLGEGGADYRLRIFTPEVELPFAGHPSVGAAWLLARLGLVRPGRVVQRCGAGDLPLDVTPDGGPVELTGGAATASDPVDPGPLLAAVGLEPGDLDPSAPPRVCGTGIGFAVLPVRPEALGRCAPDLSRLAGFAHPWAATGVYVVAWDPAARAARARMFAGDVGVAEDAATGSAALALGVWLAASRLVAADGATAYRVAQGVEMGRSSHLACRVDVASARVTRARVAGAVVPVASGRIAIPAP